MEGRSTLNFLGEEYQDKLLSQIVDDSKFATAIMPMMEPNYFDEQDYKVIVHEMKKVFEESETVPDIESIRARLTFSQHDQATTDIINARLDQIRDASKIDAEGVQDIGLQFCKHKEITKTLNKMASIANRQEFTDYPALIEMMTKAVDKGTKNDGGLDVFSNPEDVLKEDFRLPISTGISGLDSIMNGGLARGELGVILAPFGVGKSTIVTKMANSALRDGLKVLQIFFEDDPKVIQRKHFCCWANEGGGNMTLNELSENSETVIDRVRDIQSSITGQLELIKMPSYGSRMSDVKMMVRKYIAKGFKPDIIFLDYIDVVDPSKHHDDINVGEGYKMREFETMLSEYNIAGWTCVQGNRSSINSEHVSSDQMGGSIKKGQIGHFIISINKTGQQRELNTANAYVLKSRFGRDGIKFDDIIFNNATMQIELYSDSFSPISRSQEFEIRSTDRVKEALERSQLRKLEGNTNNN